MQEGGRIPVDRRLRNHAPGKAEDDGQDERNGMEETQELWVQHLKERRQYIGARRGIGTVRQKTQSNLPMKWVRGETTHPLSKPPHQPSRTPKRQFPRAPVLPNSSSSSTTTTITSNDPPHTLSFYSSTKHSLTIIPALAPSCPSFIPLAPHIHSKHFTAANCPSSTLLNCWTSQSSFPCLSVSSCVRQPWQSFCLSVRACMADFLLAICPKKNKIC